MCDWISSEQLPQDDMEVLFVLNGDVVPGWCYPNVTYPFEDHIDAYGCDQVSHYMPLPPLPKTNRIDAIIALWDAEKELPRVSRPAHISPGVAWTTKESSDLSDRIIKLMRTMTREEMREAVRIYDGD